MSNLWSDEAEAAIRHNVADVMQNGPGLRWGRKTAALAIDRSNHRVLKTGLGAMGVGTLWCPYLDEDADWADLPEQDSLADEAAVRAFEAAQRYLVTESDADFEEVKAALIAVSRRRKP